MQDNDAAASACLTAHTTFVAKPHTSAHTFALPPHSWYGTIQLFCPWMMDVNPLSGYDIEFVVLNSGHPENVWTLNVENTTTGYRCVCWGWGVGPGVSRGVV